MSKIQSKFSETRVELSGLYHNKGEKNCGILKHIVLLALKENRT